MVIQGFEWLVLHHLKSCLPGTDQHQFAHMDNRSTADAISTDLHGENGVTLTCHWIRSFLMDRLLTGTPQGCVLSPFLFTLDTGLLPNVIPTSS